MRRTYPNATYTITKRAILIEFHEPIDDEDPSVDLIVALTRRDAPGLSIPNTEQDCWDPSHPEKHTELLLGPTRTLRVHRARVIRLAKDAINETADPVISSFNVEALALLYISEIATIADSLQTLFVNATADLARRPTPDPAGVSKPIRLLASQDEVVQRMRFFAERLTAAVDNRHDKDKVREAFGRGLPQPHRAADKRHQAQPRLEPTRRWRWSGHRRVRARQRPEDDALVGRRRCPDVVRRSGSTTSASACASRRGRAPCAATSMS